MLRDNYELKMLKYEITSNNEKVIQHFYHLRIIIVVSQNVNIHV